jgi:hypothetical protein
MRVAFKAVFEVVQTTRGVGNEFGKDPRHKPLPRRTFIYFVGGQANKLRRHLIRILVRDASQYVDVHLFQASIVPCALDVIFVESDIEINFLRQAQTVVDSILVMDVAGVDCLKN